MPRLTNTDYLNIRHYLAGVWRQDRSAFGLVSSADQQRLHAYFRLTEELTDTESLKHRTDLTRGHPSLPHGAGRALRHLANPRQSLRRRPARAVAPSRRGSREHNITVRAIVRPQPDVKRLAQALLALARQEAREQQERQA